MRRYQIIVEGRVQGVGFRAFCTRNATELKLTGTVRNMENGMVEIFAQGEDENLLKFLGAIMAGNRFIRVDDYKVKEIPLVDNESRFTYDYYSSSF